MDWNDLRYFLALARLGSGRGAATELGVSHSTVARRLDALEARMGTRLFDRHRDGYRLTEAGARMVPAAERVEDEVCALTRDVAGRDRQLVGTVRMTLCDEYVAAQILRDLRPWCAAHPGVELVVDTDARPLNLARGEADLAVRALARDGAPPDYLVGHRLAPIVCASYGARAHAARLDPTRAGTRWLGFDDNGVLDLLVRQSRHPDLPRWGSFASLRLLVQAAAEGLGLVFLPTYVGDAEPALQRLDDADGRHLGDLWLLFHPDLRENVRVQSVRTLVRDGFARRQALYEGWTERGPPRPESGP